MWQQSVDLRKRSVTEEVWKEGSIYREYVVPNKGPVDPHPDQDARNLPMLSRKNQMSMRIY